MLRYLQVRDFAIIDAVEIEFGAGMTALTGETGAGKSILVDAVTLALGGRAVEQDLEAARQQVAGERRHRVGDARVLVPAHEADARET